MRNHQNHEIPTEFQQTTRAVSPIGNSDERDHQRSVQFSQLHSSENSSAPRTELFARQLNRAEYSLRPSPTGEILSVWELERISRRMRDVLPKVSCAPLQVILECSKYGRTWVPLVFLAKKTVTGRDSFRIGQTLQPAFEIGLLESAKGCYRSNTNAKFIRIAPKADLVGIKSHDGQLMSSIQEAMNTFMGKYRNTTPMLALILSAIMVRGIVAAKDISFFVTGSKRWDDSNSTTRLIGKMHECGLIYKNRIHSGQGQPVVVSEVME